MKHKIILTSMLGTLLIAGCNDASTKLTQADQKELVDLRTEKKAWETERTMLQDSLELIENTKSEAISERDQLREELKACQEKQTSSSETKPEGKGKK